MCFWRNFQGIGNLKTMKICYLTHTLNPKTGAGAFSAALISGVQDLKPGTTVSVLTSEDLIPPSKWGILKNFWKIRERIRECDVIHALDGFPYGVVAAYANLGINKPLMVTAIGTGALQKLTHWLYGPLLQGAYRRARYVTVPSRFVAKELSRAVSGLEVRRIPHGVFLPQGKEDALPAGISGSYILSVGAIKRRKGYHISIPVFAEVARKHRDLIYVIVGNPKQSPDYFKELEEIAEREGVKDRIIYLSNLSASELASVYKNAELFLLMSQNIKGDVEGFGLVFLEAAAYGLPVIGSKDTGAEDAIAHERNGYLLEAADVPGIVLSVERLLGDKALREQFSVGSRMHAEEMEWKNQIKKYIELYETL